MQLNFDLRTLSDRVLNLMLRGAGEGQRLEAPVARAVHDALAEELARRTTRSDTDAGPEQKQIKVILPSLGPHEAAVAYQNLRVDVMNLEYVASLAGDAEAQELRQAAAFLFEVGQACLPPKAGAELASVQ
jgi:hypothetical protein